MDSLTRFFSSENRDLSLPLNVTGIGYKFNQDKTIRPTGYGDFQLTWTLSGKGIFTYEHGCIEMNSNNLLLFLKDEPHEYYPSEEPWIVNWVSFAGDNLYELLQYLDITSTSVFSNIGAKIFMNNLIECINSSSFFTKYDLCLHTMEFINTLAKGNLKSNRLSSIHHKLQPILEFIENNYSNIITLAQLAKIIDVSEQHLCVLFKKAFHLRPFDYINNIRINHSKTLLIEDKKKSISKIAQSCGYENICYFNQVFKKKTGISPSEFRMSH